MYEEFSGMEQTKKKFTEYDDKYCRLMYRDSEYLNNGWMSDNEKKEYEKSNDKSEFIRKLWNKKADKNFFKSIVKVHWFQGFESLKKLFSMSKTSNEICCNGFYKIENEISFKTWTNFGAIMDGDVLFAANHDLETGWREMKKMVHSTDGKSIAYNKDTFLSLDEISKKMKNADIQAGNELILTNFEIKKVIIKNNPVISSDEIKNIQDFCSSKNIDLIIMDKPTGNLNINKSPIITSPTSDLSTE
jgi:hypothetical protein